VRRVSAALERGSSYASVWPKSHLTSIRGELGSVVGGLKQPHFQQIIQFPNLIKRWLDTQTLLI